MKRRSFFSAIGWALVGPIAPMVDDESPGLTSGIALEMRPHMPMSRFDRIENLLLLHDDGVIDDETFMRLC